jgi:hypothetical protein
MKESSSKKSLDYMQKLHDRDSNYFQSKSNQREARQGYIDLYKLDQKKGEDIWNHTFPKFLRKNRLKKEDFLKTRFRKAKNSDFNATIKPEPQGPIIEKNSVEIVNEEIIQQNPQPSQLQIKNEYIEPETVESAFEGLWALLKLCWPLESLTKEEKESLGMMWLPVFRKYLTENWAYIGLPFIVTIGIFTKHIKEARDKKKKKEEKENPEKELTENNMVLEV